MRLLSGAGAERALVEAFLGNVDRWSTFAGVHEQMRMEILCG